MWEEMRRVQVPISKHSQTAVLWTCQSPSKKNNITSNSTSHGQEVRNLAKVPYRQCTCPSPSAHLLGVFGHGNISIPPLRAQNYRTIRLLTLCVKFDKNITKNTEVGAPAVNSVYSFYLKCTISYQSILRQKMLLFWSLHFLSAFFHKISSNISRNMLKIQTESYFSVVPSKWPISVAKRFFTVFGPLRVTWRQREDILPPTHPQNRLVCFFFCKFEGFIRSDSWGTVPLQWLCQNMVRTWYTAWFLLAHNAHSKKVVWKSAETSNTSYTEKEF